MTRAWPADWEERRSGAACPMCANSRDEDNAFGARVYEGGHANGFLQRADVGQAGYTIVIWKHRHVADPTELTDDEAAGYWRDVLRVARGVEACYRPAKLNLMMLGNLIPHLHTHVVPRYVTDDSPGTPPRFMRVKEPHAPLAEGDLQDQARRLRETIERTAIP